MKDILYFCPRWGSEHLNWNDFFVKAKSAGYDGIEYAVSREVSRQELTWVWERAEHFKMQILPQHYDTTAADFETHLKRYQEWFEKVLPFKPFKINSQTGRDIFSKEQNIQLIQFAEQFSWQAGVPVCHETHRGKFSFAAHTTEAYLNTLEDLRLTLDASHWVNVAESLLEDQAETMELAISRTDHIHTRIGHAQGPQVPDPRMQEWQESFNAHLNWWDQVVARKRTAGEQLTMTTEFGPFPYLVNLPGSGHPIADQWEINVWTLQFLKQRYATQ